MLPMLVSSETGTKVAIGTQDRASMKVVCAHAVKFTHKPWRRK